MKIYTTTRPSVDDFYDHASTLALTGVIRNYFEHESYLNGEICILESKLNEQRWNVMFGRRFLD